jgi:hypothetical protein
MPRGAPGPWGVSRVHHDTLGRHAAGRCQRDPSVQGQRALTARGVMLLTAGQWPGRPPRLRPGGSPSPVQPLRCRSARGTDRGPEPDEVDPAARAAARQHPSGVLTRTRPDPGPAGRGRSTAALPPGHVGKSGRRGVLTRIRAGAARTRRSWHLGHSASRISTPYPSQYPLGEPRTRTACHGPSTWPLLAARAGFPPRDPRRVS